MKHRNDRSIFSIIGCAILAGSSILNAVEGAVAGLTIDGHRLVGAVPTGPQYSSGRHAALRRTSSDWVPHNMVRDVPELVGRMPIDRFDRQSDGGQDHALVRALSCRGGAREILRLSKYFIGSRSRCWAVLFLAILIDSCTITMMKVAQDEGSVAKLAISYLGYFLR